ncbi:MAG: hypothetical protein M0P57_05225 [Syntrophales bacterium]|nr:hypothetical protein [Syntrophales bacterium]
MVRDSRLWNLGIKCVRPMMNRYTRDGVLKNMGSFFEGWFKERDFPAMAKKTFHERWRDLKKKDSNLQ